MPEKIYSIGEVVRQLSPECDVSESSLRFWEKVGLISASRTRGGHRVFTEEDLARIRIIKRLQTQRYMPLEEIRKLCESGLSTEELAAIADFKENFFRPLGFDPTFQPLTRSELAKRTVLSEPTLIALEEAGALRSVGEADALYDEDGLRVAEIFREIARYGMEPEDFRETCGLTRQLVEVQYRNYLEKIFPNLPSQQEAALAKSLNELGQELFRIIFHQTFLSVGTRLAVEGRFVQAHAKKSQKAKTP